jgi:hypothetical protein
MEKFEYKHIKFNMPIVFWDVQEVMNIHKKNHGWRWRFVRHQKAGNN